MNPTTSNSQSFLCYTASQNIPVVIPINCQCSTGVLPAFISCFNFYIRFRIQEGYLLLFPRQGFHYLLGVIVVVINRKSNNKSSSIIIVITCRIEKSTRHYKIELTF